MGIIQRFKDIMSSNVNALLDRAEDPEKMIDQYLRNLESDLAEVKKETASVMAEETRCKRELNACIDEVAKLESYAEKAILSGNDDDARKFLAEKASMTEKQESLQQAYDVAADNALKMRQMHDKLSSDIAELNARKDSVKAKIKVAKTQEKVNKLGGSMEGAQSDLGAFSRIEAQADKMLDEANAMAELNAGADDADISDLKKKYDTSASSAVEDELAALKAKLGKQS